MQLTRRNIGYMCRLGSSAFLCEVAIACMMFVGNIVFIHYLQEEGVAAFSIAFTSSYYIYGVQRHCTIRSTHYQLQSRI